MGKRSSYTKTRTRKERALRYVLRRRPCVFILFGEIALLFFFIFILIICASQFTRMRRQHLLLKAEDDLLKKMDNHITFAHCEYLPVKEFNTEFCDTRIREESYAYRHFTLSAEETQNTCIDRQEQVNCHEEFDNPESKTTWVYSWNDDPKDYKLLCPGLLGYSMPYARFNTNRTYFFMDSVRLSQYVGRYVLSQELVIRCPHCSVRTRQFKVVNNGVEKCYVKLKTILKGWPAIAEQCDDVITILHASDKCDPPELT